MLPTTCIYSINAYMYICAPQSQTRESFQSRALRVYIHIQIYYIYTYVYILYIPTCTYSHLTANIQISSVDGTKGIYICSYILCIYIYVSGSIHIYLYTPWAYIYIHIYVYMYIYYIYIYVYMLTSELK